MITIIFSTKQDEDFIEKRTEQFRSSSGFDFAQVLSYKNNGQYSLSEIYNKGLEEAIYDIVVCVHDDVVIEDGWGYKLLVDFQSNENIAIIGKAGTCLFPKSCIYWENLHTNMVGQVFHIFDKGQKYETCFSAKMPIIQQCVSIDGCFIAFDKTKIKHKFDEQIKGFHFYDHGFCIPNFIDNVGIGVTSSFSILHFSNGEPNQEFFDTRKKFSKKWDKMLPLSINESQIYAPSVPKYELHKVAIIIPTKDKVDMLFDCVNSFLSKCSNFDLFIADTGSTSENIEKIEKFIAGRDCIKLIKYDYYNFAKINNDVFIKNIDGKYKYVLFSNNDIVVMNDVISAMLRTFGMNEKIGSVGARLHFKDNKIQHEGMLAFSLNRVFHITHNSIYSFYPKSVKENETIGNTAALMMINTSVFKECGMFNERYKTCFEDVELNFKLNTMGYVNYVNCEATAYHYESQTRSEDKSNEEKIKEDFERLILFVNKNYRYLRKFIKDYIQQDSFSKN